jgi:penicillin-binding protein 1C
MKEKKSANQIMMEKMSKKIQSLQSKTPKKGAQNNSSKTKSKDSKKTSKKIPQPKKLSSLPKKLSPLKTKTLILLKKLLPKSKTGKIVLGLLIIISFVIGYFIFKDLPSPTKLSKKAYSVSTLIFDRHGELLYEIYADENRTPIILENLPSHLLKATIAIEDQNFYRHFGFSFQGIIRAFKNTVFNDKLQGGSTITQQLVKTALLTPERTLQRKIREAVLTIAVEVLYSKDEILEMYLNHIPYGGTAYGIEAAAQRFFGKSAKDLSLSESALLAGLPQAPTTYSPFSNPEKSKARQFEVLRRMVEDGFISQDEADHAFQIELEFAPPATNIKAPHFVFYIKSILEERYGLQTVEKGGLRVTTTLDLTIQEAAEASLSAHVKYLEPYKVSNGAALVTKPNTGEILAMVGSKDYFDVEIDGKVNVTQRLRQPGSSIKPLNYVTGLQLKNFSPATVILDIPTCFQVFNQPEYCPQNYDVSFHGPVNFRQALASSYNIPAVKVLAKNTLESFIATSSAMGISSFQDSSRYGLSLTLGGGEVTMLDMATAFGTIANQGVRKDLEPLLKIEDYQGTVLYQYDPDQTKSIFNYFFDENEADSNLIGKEIGGLTRVLNREPAFLITDIISDNDARAGVFGRFSDLYFADHQVGAKTGTTNDHKDSWTIGFTPEFLVTSWVGNNDSTSMSWSIAGINGAGPIFNDIMSFVLLGQQPVIHPQPSGVESKSACTLTGSVPADGQPCSARAELFWNQYIPESNSSVKRGIWVNKDTGIPAFFPLDPDNPPENTDNLELREHIIVSDYFTQEFCLDCPWPRETKEDGSPGKITYPVTKVNTITDESETILEGVPTQ